LVLRNSAFGSEAQVLHLLTCGRLAKCSEHIQISFWVQWSRMDVSQLQYSEIVHSGPKHKFCIFLCVQGNRNALKHTQTSFWVQWSRMDASQLRYLEIVHSGPKQKFCIFLCVQGKRNALKHSQTSFWVQWSRVDASQLRYREIVHSGRKHNFASSYMRKVSEML
jgi:DNA relaxase NicK